MDDYQAPDRRTCILDTVAQMTANFLYYDRKEDSDLPVGAIEQAIASGVVTKDEIVAVFRDGLG